MAIDDFGTGYSSLVYLNELTFDTLKIDRAFVSRLPSKNATAIVHAVIAVARALGKETVAEGVELTIQEDTLKKLGCGVGQGYLYGKPVVAADFSDWAKGRSRRRDRSSAA